MFLRLVLPLWLMIGLIAAPLFAGSFTDYFEAKIVGHTLAGEAWTPASTYYAALFTASPGEATGGTEATGGSYARQSFTFTRTASSAGNTAVIEFPVSTADRADIVAVGYFDSLTGGNLCGYHIFPVPKSYDVSQTIRFPIANLTSTVD